MPEKVDGPHLVFFRVPKEFAAFAKVDEMARFSSLFQSNASQAELDFVDIDLEKDNRLYLDPYAIQIKSDEWSTGCGDLIRSFFNEVLDTLRSNNMVRATHLLDHLHEPNETFLGVSRGFPDGRGVGRHKAASFALALRNSKAFQTGVLSDISETELFIHGVGPDTISDLTTNILRGRLADYTKEQCDLHRVPTRKVASLGPRWSIERRDWESHYYDLPVIGVSPILLIPKYSIRRGLSINSQEFYNFHMIEFLRQEYLDSRGSLVQTFKDGTPYVTKASVKARHPLIKDDLASFVRDNPEILEMYKKLKGADGTLDREDLEANFDGKKFARVLATRLQQIPTGNAKAGQFHSLMLGICTFLFHPQLITPVKERELHQGRKRIDIKFTNSGQPGFFNRLLQSPYARAISILIECKNYTNDIHNPELDQMTSRFGHQRGFFGMIVCRKLQDRERIVDACRDTANDKRGLMLVLEDQDIYTMLHMVENGNRTSIDYFLQKRLDEITL